MSPRVVIRGLTIKQPWCTAIVGYMPRRGTEWVPGPKYVENRGEGLGQQADNLLGQGELWLALHAGVGRYWKKSDEPRGMAELREVWPLLPELADMPTGAILGVARVSRVARPEELVSRYASGPCCLVLVHVHAFLAPLRIERGDLGLWTPPQDVMPALRRAVADAPTTERGQPLPLLFQDPHHT